jgi:LacI family transcriptional regulator
MYSIHDVAEHAGVSSTTVSRYLNNSGYVSEKTRQRIAQAIKELDYMPSSIARSLNSKSTLTIGLLLPDIVNTHWTSVARGAEDEARKQGYNVILCNTDSDSTKLQDYISILLQRQVDGIIYVPISGSKSSPLEIFEPIRKKKTPAVLMDVPLPGADLDTVLVDSRTGAYRLAELLVSMQHRRIAILTGEQNYYTTVERVLGALDAFDSAGIHRDDVLIRYSGYDMVSSHEAAQEILRLPQRPTAFFAANNMVALGIIQAVREAGLHIPNDVSLVCFDDIPQASLIDPFLTVAAQPAYEMGEAACKLLIRRIDGEASVEPRTVIFPVEIIRRRSCAPVGATNG